MLWTNGSVLTHVTLCPGFTCRIVGVKHASAIWIVVPVPLVIPPWQPPPACAGAAPRSGATPTRSTSTALGIDRMMGLLPFDRCGYTGDDGLVPSGPGEPGRPYRLPL